MDLTVVVPVELLLQDCLSLIDVGDVLPYAGPYQSILQPSIRAFDLTFCLGRQRIDNLDVTVLEHLLPLRTSFIGEKLVFPPE